MLLPEPQTVVLGDGSVVTVNDFVKYWSSTNKKWMDGVIVGIQTDTEPAIVSDDNGGYTTTTKTETKIWVGKQARFEPRLNRPYWNGTITYHVFDNIRRA